MSVTGKWNIKHSASYHVEFPISFKKIHVKINFKSFILFLTPQSLNDILVNGIDSENG